MGTMDIKIKRVYDKAESTDGVRILVDRLWPRGLSKEDAKVDVWIKSVAPSDELRKWYAHDPDTWLAFKKRYFAELDSKAADLNELLVHLKRGRVCFLYSSKERNGNNAVALRDYVKHVLH
jgi:uncharacterized protein YeaO (DUF488 family)